MIMAMAPILSLCIPTNGVAEWVFPVLDSIFGQHANSNEYEVVVTDNGYNKDFKEAIKKNYVSRYANLVYIETEAQLFLNEIEAYKRARGELIKFVNHRTRLVEGVVEQLICFAKENLQEKPIIYYANGVFPHLQQARFDYSTFDLFVKDLSYWSSWSTGMTIWKSDFDKIPKGTAFNYLFPHITILFQERTRNKYIIDNTVIMDEIPVGNKPKGNYDLFYAFAVEYIGVLLDLLRTGDISRETFLFIKEENLKFLSNLYFDFVIRKRYCSYDLSSYCMSIQVFYSRALVRKQLFAIILERGLKKLKSLVSA